MKIKLIITILLFSCLSSYSQNNYLIISKLSINDSIAFTALQYGRKDYGYGVVNSKGVMAWQIPAKGFPISMGKFNNNMIVFYASSDPGGVAPKELHAAIIDIKTQKFSIDKLVYTNNTDYQLQQSVLNDPDSNFIYLLIRNTALKKGFASYMNNADSKFAETTQLSAITLDANLEIHSKDFKSAATGSIYIDACVSNTGDLYICSSDNEHLTTERFDNDANLKGKLSADISIRDKSKLFMLIDYDNIQGNCTDIAIAYKNKHKDDALRIYRFSFNEQKAYASEETVLDKDYARSLEKTAGLKSLSNFKSMDELYAVQTIKTQDKIIILKEIQYSTSEQDHTVSYYRNGAIITIYSKKDMQKIRDIVIDKEYGTFIMGGLDIASRIINGKLYTVTCELTSPGKYKTYLYKINLDDGTMEKNVIDKEEAGKGWVTDPTVVLWFANNFVVPFDEAKAFFKLKFETTLQSVNY